MIFLLNAVWRLINVPVRAALSRLCELMSLCHLKNKCGEQNVLKLLFGFQIVFLSLTAANYTASPQCAHAESSLYIPAEMSVLGLKEEPSGCKYFGTMCVSLLCMLRFLKPVLVMYWMPHKYAKYMMNVTPFFCNNTAVKQFWQVQVKLPNSLSPDTNHWNVMCVTFQHKSCPDPVSVVGDLRLGPPHRAGPVLYAHFIHLMIKMKQLNLGKIIKLCNPCVELKKDKSDVKGQSW